MKIFVLSQAKAQKYSCSEPHVVISILTPEARQAQLPPNKHRLDVLRLYFHDFTGEEPGSNLLTLFSSYQANQITDFLEKNQMAKTIICHCEGGMSRSAGVAAALSKYYNGDDSFYFKKYDPNKLVYKLLLETLQQKSKECTSSDLIREERNIHPSRIRAISEIME
jgi:predicted protein tyrosine phosphatase